MTNERAVEILNLDLDILGQYGGESAEAYKMAIQALESQPQTIVMTKEEFERYLANEDLIVVKRKFLNEALEAQPTDEDCRNCKKWNKCPCRKEGHENGTSIGYSIGECKDYEPNRCDSCTHSEEQDGSNCYECVKGMADNFEAQPKIGYISIDVNKLAKEVAEKALDEITYEGKTIREWAEILVKQEPCEDCISREEMLKYQQYLHGKMSNEENHKLWNFIKGLPSVTPKYTDEEIDKAQAVEQAYVDNMVELAVEEIKERYSDAIGKMKKAIDEMTEIHSDGEFYIKNVDAKWIISKYLCGAEMSGGEEE